MLFSRLSDSPAQRGPSASYLPHSARRDPAAVITAAGSLLGRKWKEAPLLGSLLRSDLIAARGGEVVPQQRVGHDAEQLLAVEGPIAIRVSHRWVGTVDVELVAIGDAVGVGIRIARIQPEFSLQLIGVVVGVEVSLGSHRDSFNRLDRRRVGYNGFSGGLGDRRRGRFGLRSADRIFALARDSRG